MPAGGVPILEARKGVGEHLDAGADHVAIQALPASGDSVIDFDLLEALAPTS